MTTVTFRTDGARLTGFTFRGHSGARRRSGYDLVCAAVTSAVRLTECVVNDALTLSAPVEAREEVPSVTLDLPQSLSPEDDRAAQAVLAGLRLYTEQLMREHPREVRVRTEGTTN